MPSPPTPPRKGPPPRRAGRPRAASASPGRGSGRTRRSPPAARSRSRSEGSAGRSACCAYPRAIPGNLGGSRGPTNAPLCCAGSARARRNGTVPSALRRRRCRGLASGGCSPGRDCPRLPEITRDCPRVPVRWLLTWLRSLSNSEKTTAFGRGLPAPSFHPRRAACITSITRLATPSHTRDVYARWPAAPPASPGSFGRMATKRGSITGAGSARSACEYARGKSRAISGNLG